MVDALHAGSTVGQVEQGELNALPLDEHRPR